MTTNGHGVEKEMAPHSSVLAWRIPWTEEPGGLQSKGSQRVGHNCCDAHTGHGIPINSAHEEGSSCGYYCYACSKLSAGRRRHGEHGVQGQGCRPGALGWWEDPRSMGRTRSLTNRVRQRTKPLPSPRGGLGAALRPVCGPTRQETPCSTHNTVPK